MLTLTALDNTDIFLELPCCHKRYQDENEACAPIHIETYEQNTDDIYRWTFEGEDRRQNCIPFSRSSPYCFEAYITNNASREQFNALTAYLDLSSVYGSERNISERLRETASMKKHFFH